MHIVISALHFDWDRLTECLARARGELGLDGVELSWHASFARPHCTAADFAELRRPAGREGLALSAHLWENLALLGRDRAVAALRVWLERCPETGVGTLILHGGSWPDQREGLQRTRDILAESLPLAQAAGVTLCLENHYAFDYQACHELLSEPWEFREVLRADCPTLAFCFDTGHGHMTRNGAALIRELAPYLHYVHLADNHGEHDDHCGFRQGTVPWDEYFDTLACAGFDGCFCVEFPVRADHASFRACVGELRERFG